MASAIQYMIRRSPNHSRKAAGLRISSDRPQWIRHIRRCVIQPDLAIDDFDVHRAQSAPDAGTTDALAGVGIEQRVMRRADELRAVRCEHIVRPPVEQVTGVRAAIHVRTHSALMLDDKGTRRPFATAHGEMKHAGIGEIGQRADQLFFRSGHGVVVHIDCR